MIAWTCYILSPCLPAPCHTGRLSSSRHTARACPMAISKQEKQCLLTHGRDAQKLRQQSPSWGAFIFADNEPGALMVTQHSARATDGILRSCGGWSCGGRQSSVRSCALNRGTPSSAASWLFCAVRRRPPDVWVVMEVGPGEGSGSSGAGLLP